MSPVILFCEHFGQVEPETARIEPLPPAIYRLATHLRKRGVDVSTVALFRAPHKLFEEVCERVLSASTEVVGVSTTLLYFHPLSVEASTDFVWRLVTIRRHAPNAKIVLGGSQIGHLHMQRAEYQRVLKHVDMVVDGAGEEILEAIISNTSIRTSAITPVKTYTDVMYPHTTFSNSTIEYDGQDLINKHDAIGIEYSRGCIFKCSFCDYPKIGKGKSDWVKDMSVMRDELVRNYETMGTQHYYFTDSLLNDSLDRVLALTELTTSLPFQISFSAYIRLDLIHRWPEMAKLLHQAGMLTGVAGIESINDASAKSVRKGLGLERVNETLEICRGAWKGQTGISGCFILGLPHDTPDTPNQIIEWSETELVRDTITDMYVAVLSILNPEMHGKGYTWSEGTPSHLKSGLWTNQNGYSYNQVVEDVKRVGERFYSRYEVPARFNAFKAPQMLAFARQYGMEDEVRQFYLTRKKSQNIQTLPEWNALMRTWYSARRERYIHDLFDK